MRRYGSSKSNFFGINGLAIALGLSVLCVSGCADNPPQRGQIYTTPPAPMPHLDPDPNDGPLGTDPNKQNTNDPLTDGGKDPLLGDTGSHHDALLSGSDPSGTDPLTVHTSPDPLAHPSQTTMPTAHSHWIRGSIVNASVEIVLNGSHYGTFRTFMDRDITMSLHKGINSITFIYTPQTSGSSTQLSVIEGEHVAPMPPLATFSVLPGGMSRTRSFENQNQDDSGSITETHLFNAA